MKKHILLFSILLYPFIYTSGQNQELEKTLNVLDKTLKNREQYSQKKEQHLKEIKRQIDLCTSDSTQYVLNKQIIGEYLTYSCDSSIYYIERNIEIANKLNNKDCKDESLIMLAKSYTLAGLFAESYQILTNITPSDLPRDLQGEYYSTYNRFYDVLIKYTNDNKYRVKYKQQMLSHLDMALPLMPDVDRGAKKLKIIYRDLIDDKYDVVIDELSKQIPLINPESHQYAIATSCLAYAYMAKGGHPELQKLYLAKAAITDAKLAIKDHSALLNLAILLHADSDSNSDRAYKYIRIALDDINFYGSRHRNTLFANALPIIEHSYLNKIEKQKEDITITLIVVSILAVGLLFASIYIYKQMRIVTKARRSLKLLNKKLDEANLIKEEYIGYFLNQCAVYVNKLDEYKQFIYRKVKSGQINDVVKPVSSTTNQKKDIEELYTSFDVAFLKLYPNFVSGFNNLLKEEERYKLKSNELNTELRIFALIRLGITDNKQISAFLRYSIQTIYNYRSKVKGKALNEKDDFEEKVKNIGVL